MKKRDPKKQQKLQKRAIKRALYEKERRQKFVAKKSAAHKQEES
ncbi:MAG: hypothetical protein WAS36_00485 [Candidatus Saccharimonadales bacterium]